MRELNITLDSKSFNLVWKFIHAHEKQLLQIVDEHGEDSDEGADALNDLAYLRLYKIGLKEKAEKYFMQTLSLLKTISLSKYEMNRG